VNRLFERWSTVVAAYTSSHTFSIELYNNFTMGICCSCCTSRDDGDGDDKATMSTAELELQSQQAEKDLKSLAVARGMSAPTIEVEDRTKVN
jgi:hypothetical protein